MNLDTKNQRPACRAPPKNASRGVEIEPPEATTKPTKKPMSDQNNGLLGFIPLLSQLNCLISISKKSYKFFSPKILGKALG